MKNLIFISILILATLASCKKDEKDPIKDVDKATEMVVPNGFKFENSKDLTFTIKVTDQRFGAVGHRITIYDADPTQGGKVLAIGGGTVNRPFVGRIDKSVLVKELFIEKKAPSGESFVKKVVLTSNDLQMELGENSSQKIEQRSTSPDCVVGCTDPLPPGGNLNLSGNKVYCMTEPFTGSITLNGNVTLRICANVTITSLSMWNSNSTLIVTSTGSATFTSAATIAGELENFGTLTFNNNATFQGNGGILINHGDVTTNQLTITENTSTNNGSINIASNLVVNTNGILVNNCEITVAASSDIYGKIHNHGYLKYNNNLTVSGTGVTVQMHDGAMLVAQNLTMNQTIQGYGSTSLVKVIQNTILNSDGALKGVLDFCDENGIENMWGTIDPSVTLSCDLYVPITSCNPEGNGELPEDDEDDDNIPDDLDDFPLDPRGAFSVFFPGEDEVHSLVYEDLWPGLGDFDMNDIVIDFRYNLILDSDNRVVQINATYELIARGGGLSSGFAVQLPILRSNVAEVTNGELEGSGSFAVIRVFDNAKDHMGVFNTVENETLLDPVIFNVAITLTNPQPLNEVGLGVYNPFIWRNEAGAGRGHEIHIAGKVPTHLVDESIFQTMEDNTDLSTGNLYLSKSNLCWGIYIPQKFSYPAEGNDITQVYLNFAEWVQSGGVLSPDWYMVNSENVNMSLLHSQR